jgi:hypothetical protein
VRGGDYLPITGAWVHPRFLVGSVLLIFLVFCVVFLLLFVFILCLVCPVLTVSLDYPFFIAPSGFSDIYFQCIPCPKGTEKNTTGCSPCRAIRFVPLSVCVKKGYTYQTMAQSMPLTLLQSN